MGKVFSLMGSNSTPLVRKGVNYDKENIILNSLMAPVILVFLYIRANVQAAKTLKLKARIHFKQVNSK